MAERAAAVVVRRLPLLDEGPAGRVTLWAKQTEAVVALVEAHDAELRERLARSIAALSDYQREGRWGWLRREDVLALVRGGGAA